MLELPEQQFSSAQMSSTLHGYILNLHHVTMSDSKLHLPVTTLRILKCRLSCTSNCIMFGDSGAFSRKNVSDKLPFLN